MIKQLTLLVLGASSACAFANDNHAVPYATNPVKIDGKGNDSAWQLSQWRNMDKHILGQVPTPSDFSGRYKLAWDESKLYLLAEIVDDVLFDQHADPTKFYWDDDCLEIFVDEDASGGEHQQNYNAFAYHIALDNQAVDIGKPNPDGSVNFVVLNDHLESYWQRQSESPHVIHWEVAMDLYSDSFDDKSPKGTHLPVALKAGKEIGFMLAYCDNDGSNNREHFMGSHVIEPVKGDKNLGYKTADVFGRIKLVK